MKRYILIILVVFSVEGLAQKLKFVEVHPQLTLKKKWSHLKKVLKDKRVIALGESLHGVKEYNAVKLELIQYLHEELGFNVLAIESDVAKNYFGNLYQSTIPDTLLLKELFTPPWHTEEHLEIVRYLKKKPNLKIIGFDVEAKNSVNQIQEKLGLVIDSSLSSVQVFQKEYSNWKEVNGRFRVTMSQRDSTMAQIAQWIINDLYKNEKIIISAANSHISNKEINGACMGELLKKEYKKDYYSIGFFHSLGNPKHVLRKRIYVNRESKLSESSIQYKFLKTGKKMMFVDIQKQNLTRKNKWLFEDLKNVIETEKYEYKMNLAKSFDGVIWIKEVTHPKYVIKNKYLDK